MKSEPKREKWSGKRAINDPASAQAGAGRNLFSEMQVSAEDLKVLDVFVSTVSGGAVSKRVSLVGKKAPDFILPDTGGREVRLFAELDSGPVVLVFFRGGWCPYCTTHLRGLQHILPRFRTMGVRLLAVSPQLPDGSLLTREANGLKFPLLSDVHNHVARRYGVACQLPQELIRRHGKLGLCLALANGINGRREFPLPATFAIGTDRRIHLSQIDFDYSRRNEPEKSFQQLSRWHKANRNQRPQKNNQDIASENTTTN